MCGVFPVNFVMKPCISSGALTMFPVNLPFLVILYVLFPLVDEPVINFFLSIE